MLATVSGQSWSHFFCRVLLGLIFLMAGWYKCFEMTPAVHARTLFTGPYADTWIPQSLLFLTGVTIPVVELVAGLLLVLGWRTREALIAVGFILLVVTYGHLLKSPLYDITGHIFPRTVLMVAVFLLKDDMLSLDNLIRQRATRGKQRKK